MPRRREKTPVMAFVIDFLRKFPGADWALLNSEAQDAGLGVVTPRAHGNAVRILRDEAARAARAEAELPALRAEHDALLAERDRVLKELEELRRKFRCHGALMPPPAVSPP